MRFCELIGVKNQSVHGSSVSLTFLYPVLLWRVELLFCLYGDGFLILPVDSPRRTFIDQLREDHDSLKRGYCIWSIMQVQAEVAMIEYLAESTGCRNWVHLQVSQEICLIFWVFDLFLFSYLILSSKWEDGRMSTYMHVGSPPNTFRIVCVG